MLPEFLDDNLRIQPPPRREVFYSIPIEIVQVCANQERRDQLMSQDLDYIYSELRLDINHRGIVEPLEVVWDTNGCAKLKEGHHRLLAAENLGMPKLPVCLIASQTPLRGYRAQLLPPALGHRLPDWFRLLNAF